MRNEELVSKWKAQAIDLGVTPELLATNEIFSQYKNLLEFCRRFHNKELVEESAVETTLDELEEILIGLRELTWSRYA